MQTSTAKRARSIPITSRTCSFTGCHLTAANSGQKLYGFSCLGMEWQNWDTDKNTRNNSNEPRDVKCQVSGTYSRDAFVWSMRGFSCRKCPVRKCQAQKFEKTKLHVGKHAEFKSKLHPARCLSSSSYKSLKIRILSQESYQVFIVSHDHPFLTHWCWQKVGYKLKEQF